MDTEYFGLFIAATPPAPTLTGTEIVPVIVSGVTNNTTTQDIANLAQNVFGTISLPAIAADLPTTLIYTAGATDEYVDLRAAILCNNPNALAGVVTWTFAWTDPVYGPQTNSSMSTGLTGPFFDDLGINFDNTQNGIAVAAGTTVTVSATIAGIYAGATYALTARVNRIGQF